MHPAIIRRRSTVSTISALRGDSETDHLARVTCREEFPEFPGFDQEDNDELSAWGEFDSFAYANESRAYQRGLTCELVETFED